MTDVGVSRSPSGVVYLSDRKVMSGPEMARLEVLERKQMNLEEQAVAECNEFLARVSSVPSGHYVKMRLEKKWVIGVVVERQMSLVVGQRAVPHYSLSDKDASGTRALLKEHMPTDLGTYDEYVQAHRDLWRLILKQKNKPAAGLQMVRAIDYLETAGTLNDEAAVGQALAQFLSSPGAD